MTAENSPNQPLTEPEKFMGFRFETGYLDKENCNQCQQDRESQELVPPSAPVMEIGTGRGRVPTFGA